ncbi:MAG: 4-hydroxy-tetrahydrodipicolinate reductase [Ferrimicrobium sp.]
MAAVKVAVLGAGGRVGSEVCRAVLGTQDLELVTAVDPRLVGIDLAQVIGVPAGGLHLEADVAACARSGAEVVIDFTSAAVAFANLKWTASHGISSVIGTTGFSVDQVEAMRSAVVDGGVSCVWSTNFSIGAVVMMQLAEIAAPYFDTVEIVEIHHNKKRDAPSGTARVTAERIEAARSTPFAPDPTTEVTVPGARGARTRMGVGIHSLRLEGAVAHQEVIFGLAGQTLTIRHDSHERASFVPGILLAVRRIGEVSGFVEGIDGLLTRGGMA